MVYMGSKFIAQIKKSPHLFCTLGNKANTQKLLCLQWDESKDRFITKYDLLKIKEVYPGFSQIQPIYFKHIQMFLI